MKGDTFQFSLAWKDTLPQPSPFRLRFAECPTEQSIWSAAGNSPDEHSNARRFCTRPNVKGDDDAKDVDAILGKLVVCGLCPCPSHVGSSSSRSSHHGVRERRVLLAVHEAVAAGPSDPLHDYKACYIECHVAFIGQAMRPKQSLLFFRRVLVAFRSRFQRLRASAGLCLFDWLWAVWWWGKSFSLIVKWTPLFKNRLDGEREREGKRGGRDLFFLDLWRRRHTFCHADFLLTALS